MSNFEYDPAAAGKADDWANRINESALYIGKLTRADATVSSSKGTKGINFEFTLPNGAQTTFSVWHEKEDGSRIDMGYNKVQALMTILGLRSLKTAEGKVSVWDMDEKKRVEVDGEVYPDLIDKDIGVALEKELTTGGSGQDSYRMNLASFFRAKDKFTASEIRDKKTKAEQIEKILKSLRTKDSRVKREAEPGQPGMGAPAGDY